MIRRPSRSTLFRYTTLFRSRPRKGMAPGQWPARLSGAVGNDVLVQPPLDRADRKSTRLNSSHVRISYAVFCLKKTKTPSGDIRGWEFPRTGEPLQTPAEP